MHNANVDNLDINEQIRFHTTDDRELSDFNHLRERQIIDNGNEIERYKDHDEEKFYKNPSGKRSQQTVMQNLHYRKQSLPKDDADHLHYKSIMNLAQSAEQETLPALDDLNSEIDQNVFISHLC